MNRGQARTSLPHVVWVYDASILTALDSATWLETTHELRKQGWPITLIAEGPTGPQRIREVEVYCLEQPDIYLLGVMLFQIRLLGFLLKRWRAVDAVLFHQMSALWLLPLRLVCCLPGQRRPLLVMDTRDLVSSQGTWRNWLRRQYFRLAHWLANHWADGQTAITRRMAELVSIPASKLWGIWPSGVRLDRFAPAQNGRRWPLSSEAVHLIYIGKLRIDCNLLPLCRAVELANAQGMAFVLSLVGEGSERPALEEFARLTDGRIRVHQPVPHAQIPDLLRQAHVGVTALPSPEDRLFGASSPVKLFEYMAAGLPVLSTRNPCHVEAVAQGTYAFWAENESEEELFSALSQVWQARTTLQERGHEAAISASAWTWEESAKKLGAALKCGLGIQVL